MPLVIDSPKNKSSQVLRVLIIEGVINTLMALIKLFVGILTNSTAIIADALHSLTDVANNVIAWLAMRVAAQPADENHPYGHTKFEQLAVFGLASLLAIVGFEVLINAFEHFGNPVEQSYLGLVILLVSLGCNIGLTLWEGRWAKRLNSSLLEADASHTFSDVLTTIAVIIGWQLSTLGYYWIDAVLAAIVAIIIFILAFRLFQKAIPILVDETHIDAKAVASEVNRNIEEVFEVSRVRSRHTGKGIYADITLLVDASMSTAKAHEVADRVEQLLADEFAVKDVVVHIEPRQLTD